MPPLVQRPAGHRVPQVLILFLAICSLAAGANSPRKHFDLAAGPATASLKHFVSQSGVQLLYVAEEVSGVTTNAVKGEFTAGDAMRRLLANTVLSAVETENGAIAINRAPDPNGSRVAQDPVRDHPKPRTETAPTTLFPAR